MPNGNRKIALYLAAVLLVWVTACGTVSAIPLSQYREKVGEAYDSLDYLNYPEEGLAESEQIYIEREQIRLIRQKLAPIEKIELPEGSFDADNRWFHASLQKIEAEKADSPARAPMIAELLDKLGTLEAKLLEVENQTAGQTTKDENKQKLAEILKRSEYQKAEKKENFIQKALNSFWEWIREVLSSKSPAPATSPTTDTPPIAPFLQFVVIAAALAVIGFLLYRFAPVLFRNLPKKDKSRGKRVILGETVAADETSENLFSEAEKLAQQGDLRAAIRKGYIAFLCELSDRKIIGLARHKTNRDYLRDVRKDRRLHENMNLLTQNYELHWYGFNDTAKEDWETFKNQYKKVFGKAS